MRKDLSKYVNLKDMEKMNALPLVSVVVPVYKVEDVIVHTLQSIVHQTYMNIELILVDDGTPDGSVAVAESYLSDKNVRWRWVRQPNSGLPTARNNGIRAARGEWVICPDSDDVLAPQAIEKMVEAAMENSVDCVFCGFKNVHDEDYDSLPRHEGKTSIIRIERLRELFLRRRMILLVPGMLLRKSFYDKVRFDKECPHDEDIHFMWQLFYEVGEVAFIDADYYNYYVRSSSMSHTLKPENYLKTSERYSVMTRGLIERFPNDKIAPLIYPKYRLGGLHVLSKSSNYKTFKETVIKDGYRRDMTKLIFQKDIRLSVYSLLFCICLPLFYKISQ